MMTEQEIYDACVAVEKLAAGRGGRYHFCSVGIQGGACERLKVHATLYGWSGVRDIRSEAETFADVFADMFRQVDEIMPDEERLASILGYTETRQAAE